MKKTQKRSLIAALTLLSAISLTRSSQGGTVYGSWTGDETLTIFTSEFVDGQFVFSYKTTSSPATFSLSYDTCSEQLSMSINDMSIAGVVNPPATVYFGPESASGSVILSYPGTPAGDSVGDFFVTYQSILPDGTIDTSIGGAVADITLDYLLEGVGEIFYASFQTVPEPWSIVQAASGVLLIAVFARTRRCRSRRWSTRRKVTR
jgi:hypothetical protein